MPLSDHEEQLLSQMERQLLEEDPKFASTMRGSVRGARGARRFLLGGLGVIGGLAGLVLSAVSGSYLFAVPAFLVMLAGAYYALSRPAGTAAARATGQSGPTGTANADGTIRPRPVRRPQSGGGFMDRLEKRWDRRRDQR